MTKIEVAKAAQAIGDAVLFIFRCEQIERLAEIIARILIGAQLAINFAQKDQRIGVTQLVLTLLKDSAGGTEALAGGIEISEGAFQEAQAKLRIRGAWSGMDGLVDFAGGFEILAGFAAIDGARKFKVAEPAKNSGFAGEIAAGTKDAEGQIIFVGGFWKFAFKSVEIAKMAARGGLALGILGLLAERDGLLVFLESDFEISGDVVQAAQAADSAALPGGIV